ncbi:MAG: PIN/TRAM domain-containing protein [Planctomycetaceae bacterium]|nr:PIN/TRAM domain-containing protein [Planctomycetaceae bacterium]
MGLIILRCIFLLVAAGVGVWVIRDPNALVPQTSPYYSPWLAWGIFIGLMLLAVGVIVGDMSMRRKRLDAITAVYFGLLVGLFLAYVLRLALTPLVGDQLQLLNTLQLVLGTVVCYICISLLMQTRNDFRFIIPYVEFAKEVKGLKPCVLDTSVVIDGRIADVVETHLFDGQLIMPKFVIGELQAIADSADRLRRGRGRRGLDILNRLRNNPDIEMVIYDRDLPEMAGLAVDQKLVALTKHLQGKLVTNDYNLNKVARLQGVSVVNLNDVANALKPVFLPGERIDVRVVKTGEEPGQGVGYLEDGTMVVIEGGRDRVNQTISVAVTSVLQTSAGRMVFGKLENGKA